MTGNMDILENMRKMLEAGKISKEDIERAFPELKEIEDERIRKAIGAAICGTTAETVLEANGVKLVDALAYLEKQKEQKPALVPERIRPKFAVGDTVCRPMWSDHTIQEIYIHCNDPVYVCINDEGTESHISMSEQDEWERKEQKPVTIVRIPKFRVGDIIQHIPLEKWDSTKKITSIDEHGYNYNLSHLGDTVSGGAIGFAFEDEYELVEQEPAEWSDEDEAAFGDLMWCIELARKSAKDENDMGNIWLAEKWVKERIKSFSPQSKQEWSEEDVSIIVSRLKDAYEETQNEMFLEDIERIKSLHPQPHWKPSEEQMTALKLAYEDAFECPESCVPHLPLKDLLNDLQKL